MHISLSKSRMLESILIAFSLHSIIQKPFAIASDSSQNSSKLGHSQQNRKLQQFDSFNVNLQAFISGQSLFGSNNKKMNDIWGWTESGTNKEYAIVGFAHGTAFFDLSSPSSPIYLGFLQTHDEIQVIWRDIKTYGNYAYIVADAVGHGMQIFDLRELSTASNVPKTFHETAHFEINSQGWRFTNPFDTDFSRIQAVAAQEGARLPARQLSDEGYAHNIAINEESGFAYLVGSNNCNGGLYMLDLSNPINPSESGCFTDFGWIFDAQCVTYDGPDGDYTDHEICFVSYMDGMGIVDVTNKESPELLSSVEESYFDSIDQGWLTEDSRYFLMGDRRNGNKLHTYTVDVSNLDFIAVVDTYSTSITAEHGNSFINGNYVYQANHRAGLRILDLSDISSGVLTEVGYFDTTPGTTGGVSDGVYGVYPFFSSGTVIISSVNEGLYVLRPKVMEQCTNSKESFLEVDVKDGDGNNSHLTRYIVRVSSSNALITRKTSFQRNERDVWGECVDKNQCFKVSIRGTGSYQIDFNGESESGNFDRATNAPVLIGNC